MKILPRDGARQTWAFGHLRILLAYIYPYPAYSFSVSLFLQAMARKHCILDTFATINKHSYTFISVYCLLGAREVGKVCLLMGKWVHCVVYVCLICGRRGYI